MILDKDFERMTIISNAETLGGSMPGEHDPFRNTVGQELFGDELLRHVTDRSYTCETPVSAIELMDRMKAQLENCAHMVIFTACFHPERGVVVDIRSYDGEESFTVGHDVDAPTT